MIRRQWTPQERLNVIGAFLNRMRSRSMQGKKVNEIGMPNHESLLMIALAPADFLNKFANDIELQLRDLPTGLETIDKIIAYAEGRGEFVGP